MASLGTMLSDLDLLGITALTSVDVKTLLNKCQREEIESYQWSFSYSNLVVNSNPGVNAGTITVTQGSTVVTGVGTAFTANMTGWFLWVGPTLTTPTIVGAVQSSTQLTLAQPYGAPGIAGSGYTLQPLYYDVYPLIEIWRVRQITLLEDTSQEQLNRIDPSRISTGGDPCIRWARAPFTAPTINGHFQIELWPRPSQYLPYIAEGKLGPIDMITNSDLPMVPSNVLEAKAMMYVCRTRTASDGDPRWAALADKYMQDYTRELEVARKSDQRRMVTLGINAGKSSPSRGIDVLYNHDYDLDN